MNDTVTRLMALADDYANTKQAAAWAEKEPLQLKPEEIRKMWLDAGDIRQALQDELARLFTPLGPVEIKSLIRGMDLKSRKDLCPFSFISGVRGAERQHGIKQAK